MNDVQKVFYILAGKASHILHEYFTLTSKYFDIKHPSISEYQRAVLKQLPITCHTTSESVLILVANMRLWDTEMLIRSIIEGTFKFLFLSYGTDVEREKKINEFWVELPAINNIKRSNRAKDLLESVEAGKLESDFINSNFIEDVKLDEETVSRLLEKYPRKYRKELEHKWSFSEIIKELTKNDLLKGLNGTFHNYGIGSHIIHQDADAATLIYDRNSRDDIRREALELSHGCREIGDILAYAAYRHNIYRMLYREEYSLPFIESHLNLLPELNSFHKQFHEIETSYQNRENR
jgi:hypothetical protein